MGVLVLKLAGPLQSWGADSRFTERKTRHEPTKSGVVGLLAAALGRGRNDSIDDLAKLPLAVRIDQRGKYERDYQTAHTRVFDAHLQKRVFGKSLPLSNRYYVSDAVFVVGIEVADDLLSEFAHALRHPGFPLYLGRRSCSPSSPLFADSIEGCSLMDAMRNHPWEATNRWLLRGSMGSQQVECEVLRDVLPDDEGGEIRENVRDYPLSFSQEHRKYAWRTVVHDTVSVTNPHFAKEVHAAHDVMAFLEEMS